MIGVDSQLQGFGKDIRRVCRIADHRVLRRGKSDKSHLMGDSAVLNCFVVVGSAPGDSDVLMSAAAVVSVVGTWGLQIPE